MRRGVFTLHLEAPAFRYSRRRENTSAFYPYHGLHRALRLLARGRKVLYAKGAGMKTPDGKAYRTAEGVRNNAKAIYRIDMVTQGFMGCPK
jgi:hypothetical protein